MKLKDLAEIGLADSASEETRRRYDSWGNSDSVCHPSKEAALATNPAAFREVETRYGSAGYIYREYPLADGRSVIKQGCWWCAPEPVGESVAFYLKQSAWPMI